MRGNRFWLIVGSSAALLCLMACLLFIGQSRAFTGAASVDGGPIEIGSTQPAGASDTGMLESEEIRKTADLGLTYGEIAIETPQPSPETEEQFKRRSFQSLLDQFDGKAVENPEWPGLTRQQLVPMVMMLSVAAVMDAAGTSTPSPRDGKSREVFESGKFDFAFLYNMRDYRFRLGDFPVYEEYNVLVRSEAARQEAARVERFKFPGPASATPDELPYSPDFFDRLSEFAHGAIALRQ